MDAANEHAPTVHRTAGTGQPPARATLNYERLALLALSILALFVALWAGLLRLGWGLPAFQPGLYVAHGPLMVCGFLGTLISLERAVALGEGWSYAAPTLSGAGALALIVGIPDPVGPFLVTLGSLGLIANFVAILRRQTALFTITMTFGAVAWFVGNCLWLAGIPIIEMFFWWTGFLVLTIVGERLELSRLAGPGERNQPLFLLGVSLFLAGLTTGLYIPALGLRVGGLGMLAMALWLARYDLARRTVRQKGLTRFIAVNLLAGYFWLAAGGLAWLWFGDDLTTFHYDVMLHTVFLGFVFSMIFAHAPVIFPAVLQRPLPYRRTFYVHSALLHLSLLLRIGGDLWSAYAAYQWGGFLNVIALLVFVGSTGHAVASGIMRSHKNAPPQGAFRKASGEFVMQHNKVLLTYENIEIAERDWLICALLWVGVGTLALGPFGVAARVGRGLFAFMLIVHTIEALYTAIRAWRLGLSAQSWFLRTVVLGSLALLALETHIRRGPRLRSVR